MTDPSEFDHALKDPAAQFRSPADLLEHEGFNREQKIEILKRWDSDARQLMAASEENMSGGERSQLHDIHEALRQLDCNPHELSKETGSKFR